MAAMEPDPRDPHVLEPGHHPTPFTADEIRAASRVGRTVRQLVEVDGRPPETRVQHWIDADADGAVRLIYELADDGSPRDVRRSGSTWLDLQRHASMPIATTTIDEVTLDSPMGPLDCLRYVANDGKAIETYWFARAMPGMPVRTERSENDRVVERVTMLSNAVEPLPADLRDPSSSG
jgi:hypothetical protein